MGTPIAEGVQLLEPADECSDICKAQPGKDPALRLGFEELIVDGQGTEIPCFDSNPKRHRAIL